MHWRVVVLLAFVLGACADDAIGPATGAGGGAGAGGSAGGPGKPAAGPVPAQCSPGELALDDGKCLAAGVPEPSCGVGFVPDGAAGCVAVLPAAPCPSGTLALPGETTCRQVAPCGAGTWGDIPTDATTEYVDWSYAGGDSDGSAAKPWPTIMAAVAAAEPAAIVAIAPGSYPELVWLSQRPVKLWGKCPTEVELGGDGVNVAVYIEAGASGSEVHDLGVTGSAGGVLAVDASGVLLDRVWIHDTEGNGLGLWANAGPTAVELHHALIERARGVAAATAGGALSMTECVLRDTRETLDGTWGRGVDAWDSAELGVRASVQLSRSLIERNADFGLQASGSDVVVEDCLVRDTAAGSAQGVTGQGIALHMNTDTGQRTHGLVHASVIERSHECGLCVGDADAQADALVVRDVESPPGQAYAFGVLVATAGDYPDHVPTLIVRSSLVERAQYVGLSAVAADLTVEATIVRDTAASVEGTYGSGLDVEIDPTSGIPAHAVVRGVRVERATSFGIGIVGSQVTIESTAIADTAPQPLDGAFGRGMSLESSPAHPQGSTVEIRNTSVERSHEVGIAVLGSDALIESTVVRATAARVSDGRAGRGIIVQYLVETGERATATIRSSLVEDSQECGLFVVGADAVVERSIVRRTLPTPEAGFGDGVLVGALNLGSALVPASLALSDSIIESSARAGISSFAAESEISQSWLDCNAIDLDDEPAPGGPADFSDQGGNRCGCGAQSWPCRALTTQLAPPPPI